MVTLANDVCESPSPAQNLLIPPSFLPTKLLFPAHQKSIQRNKKIKMSFLAVNIAPVPILF